jgi:predicted nuclease of predicted toxin-antitoxin system
MKFLIDEDLSPKVAEWLRIEDLLDIVHVRDRGLLGEADHIVLAKAYEEDRVLVTANVKDFQRLARSRELHPGIVLILSGYLSRDEQLLLMRKIVVELSQEFREGRDMINRVLEIEATGERQFYDLPLPEDD